MNQAVAEKKAADEALEREAAEERAMMLREPMVITEDESVFDIDINVLRAHRRYVIRPVIGSQSRVLSDVY